MLAALQRQRLIGIASLLLATGLGALTTACGSDCDPVYPSSPNGAASLVHVAACGESGDGSADNPYATIGEAIAASGEGATVLVAEGEYAENVKIDKSITLVGSSSPADATAAAAVVIPTADHGIDVDGATGVRIIGMKVSAASATGIWIHNGADADIEGCSVEDTAKSNGSFGFGILVDAATGDVTDSAVVRSAGVGVLFSSDAQGSLVDSDVTANEENGVSAQDTAGPVNFENNVITGNNGLGMFMVGARGIIIITNRVANTGLDQNGALGDGVLITENSTMGLSSDVSLVDNEISDNVRMGILMNGNVTGSIQGGMLSGNGQMQGASDAGVGGGIWLQEQAGASSPITISGLTVDGSRFVGVELTTGAVATLSDVNITGTTEDSRTSDTLDIVTVGDGLSVYAGALATAQNLNVSGNQRMGVISDDAQMMSSFTMLDLSGNGTDMVLQGEMMSLPMTDFTMAEIAAPGTYEVSDAAVSVQ